MEFFKVTSGEVFHIRRFPPIYVIILLHRKEIGELLKEKNLQLDTANPVLRDGFTQTPNFILRNPELSPGAKVTYAMFLATLGTTTIAFQGRTVWPKTWA